MTGRMLVSVSSSGLRAMVQWRYDGEREEEEGEGAVTTMTTQATAQTLLSATELALFSPPQAQVSTRKREKSRTHQGEGGTKDRGWGLGRRKSSLHFFIVEAR